MNKRYLLLGLGSLCGCIGALLLHFATANWATVGMVICLFIFSFVTGVIVGAVERDRIFDI